MPAYGGLTLTGRIFEGFIYHKGYSTLGHLSFCTVRDSEDNARKSCFARTNLAIQGSEINGKWEISAISIWYIKWDRSIGRVKKPSVWLMLK